MKINVLMFGPIPPPYGGMSVYIQNILESKLVKKVNLKIINTHVPVFYFKYRFFRIVLFLYFFFNFIKMLLSFPIQIVHIHTSANIGFWEKGIFAFISSVFNKKVVLHIHGSEFKEFCEQSKFKNLIIFILKRCDQRAHPSASDKCFPTDHCNLSSFLSQLNYR